MGEGTMNQTSTVKQAKQAIAQVPLTCVHKITLRSGIQPSPEFAKKGFAS
jgi:hypothetical protein